MAWIPPISFSESVKEIYQNFKSKEGRKNLGKKGLFVGAIIPSSICLGFGMLYGIASLNNGTLNYKKWPEIIEQREMQKELKIENEARNYFDKYNTNKNYVLDSAEFIKFYKEKK